MDDSGTFDHRMDKINLMSSGSGISAAGFSSSLLAEMRVFCVFCTEEQMSMCHFHEFCTLTKKDIEN